MKLKIDHQRAQDIQSKFDRLLLELAVRETNTFVGSGLGGNSLQLLVLLSLNNVGTVNRTDLLYIVENTAFWNVDQLLSFEIKDLRKEVDRVFKTLPEDKKLAVIGQHIASNHPENLMSYLAKSEEFKFELSLFDKIIDKEIYSLDDLSNQSKTMLALFVCAWLAKYLDENSKSVDYNKVLIVRDFLEKCDPYLVVFAVRKCIQIGRLIKFDLDEDHNWGHLMNKINKMIA